jgi:hypothetical protein
VQPRASRAGIQGVHGGAWRIRVQAPPVEGAANDAVCDLLAEALRLPKRDLRVVSGTTARTKVIEIDDVSAEIVRARLTAATEER